MRRSHANPLPDADFGPETPHEPSSKTRKKNEMAALQALGQRLVELPGDRLSRMEMPDVLREAVLDARRFRQHEAKRRQLQYIGRLMRDIDPDPLQAALDAFDGVSAEANARLHQLEAMREQLLADEQVLTDWIRRYPELDAQLLRQLRRNAIKERNENRPPKAYRAIYQALKALPGGSPEELLQSTTDADPEPSADNAR